MKHITLRLAAVEAHSGRQSVAGKGQFEFHFGKGIFSSWFPQKKKAKLKAKLTWNSNLRFNGHECSSGNTDKQRARQDSGQMLTCHTFASLI